MSQVERILVLRTSALGDLVLATSVLEPLRARFPGARIEWVTDPAYAPLLEQLPELARVHVFRSRSVAGVLALRRELTGRFDLAIDLQGKLRTRVVTQAAAPRKLLFRRRTLGQALRAALGSDPPLTRAHATELYAEVLRPLGIEAPGRLRLAISDQARARAEAALSGVAANAVALAPGARWATKRWPPERFAQVADALARTGVQVVLAGGPGDEAVLAAFRAALRSPLAADLSSLPLDALAAALGRMRLLIAGDSGPVHLAAAMGTRALALFGPTAPRRWGPPPPGRALSLGLACAPCSNHGSHSCPLGHHRCMRDLEVAPVVAAARELLGG
jgi:heptosyltransferase-2